MKDYIICTIDNFSYSGSEELRLLNFKYSKPASIQRLSSLFDNYKFWNSAGSNYKLSLTYTHFFYADDKFSNREDASAKATLILSQLHEFLFFLWFVKDCSCYSIQTVAFLSDKDLLLTANIPAVLSMADGKLKQQVFLMVN